jgi:hypothetical protein
LTVEDDREKPKKDQIKYPPGSWERQIHNNLKECRPTLFRTLRQKGNLDEAVTKGGERAVRLHRMYESQGLAADQVDELVRADVLLPEEDEDQPDESSHLKMR